MPLQHRLVETVTLPSLVSLSKIGKCRSACPSHTASPNQRLEDKIDRHERRASSRGKLLILLSRVWIRVQVNSLLLHFIHKKAPGS